MTDCKTLPNGMHIKWDTKLSSRTPAQIALLAHYYACRAVHPIQDTAVIEHD